MWDIHHPDTNTSMNDIEGLEKPKPFTMSAYSMSMIAIQFDPTMLPENIIDAVFYTNMFPKGTGDLGFERTIGTSKPMERTIEFSAIAQHNTYTKELGRKIATDLKIAQANYSYMKTGINQVAGNLAEAGLGGIIDDVINDTQAQA
jgi:hypothetical protein